MTTIAYRDGVMACDSCWTYGGTVDTLTTKISRLSSGALFGTAGQNDGRSLVAMLDKVKTPAQLPSYESLMALRADILGLLVLPKGRVYKIATTMTSPENWDSEMEDYGLWEISGPFAAVGSGGDMALVAMDCGKSARDAVRIACKYDPNSRAPVHMASLAIAARK
jgi:ATP-dependent protease HslVU (ClpYQ) peptidase subunit